MPSVEATLAGAATLAGGIVTRVAAEMPMLVLGDKTLAIELMTEAGEEIAPAFEVATLTAVEMTFADAAGRET